MPTLTVITLALKLSLMLVPGLGPNTSLAAHADLDGEGAAMRLGRKTAHHASLIAPAGQDFFGLQMIVRHGNPCQIRAFFDGAPPRVAQYCAGRITRRHVDNARYAVLEPGDRVNGLAVCMADDDRIGALRLYTFSGAAVTARAEACVTEYRAVWCRSGWRVQGVQLYFDRAAGGMSHARLVGLRPLCADAG